MDITKPGKYRLKSELQIRLSNGCFTISSGKTIEVTQVDKVGHKVIGPQLRDWIHWKIDAEEAI